MVSRTIVEYEGNHRQRYRRSHPRPQGHTLPAGDYGLLGPIVAVSAFANARLDGRIQENSKERVDNANLQEVVISCETDDVSIERIQVAGGMV